MLNLSLGSPTFDLIDEGIVVVAAMGNDYEDGNPKAYPAGLDGVCAVGATDQADRRGVRQITIKVDPAGVKNPAAAVRDALKALRPDLAASAKVEEVFPGVGSGNRVGMVVVRLGNELSTTEYEALLQALRARDEVTYAEPAAPRKSRT